MKNTNETNITKSQNLEFSERERERVGKVVSIFNNANRCRIADKIVAEIPVEDLYIDYSYQRVSNINKLVDNWDYRKCSLLTVNYRESEHKFYVINGVHRVHAAKMNNQPVLACEIFYNLSVTEEAYLFSTQDDDVESVKAFDKYKANILWGEENSVILKNMCDKYNIKVVGNRGSKGQCGCLKALSDTLSFFSSKENKEQKEKALDWIFDIYDRCGYRSEPLGLSKNYIIPITSVYNSTKDSKLKEVSDIMVEVLSNINLETMKSYANVYYPFVGSNHSRKMSFLFKDIASGVVTLQDMMENIKNNALSMIGLSDDEKTVNRRIAIERCGIISNNRLTDHCLFALDKVNVGDHFNIRDFLKENDITSSQFANLKTRNIFVKNIFNRLKTDKVGVYCMTDRVADEIREYVSIAEANCSH